MLRHCEGSQFTLFIAQLGVGNCVLIPEFHCKQGRLLKVRQPPKENMVWVLVVIHQIELLDDFDFGVSLLFGLFLRSTAFSASKTKVKLNLVPTPMAPKETRSFEILNPSSPNPPITKRISESFYKALFAITTKNVPGGPSVSIISLRAFGSTFMSQLRVLCPSFGLSSWCLRSSIFSPKFLSSRQIFLVSLRTSVDLD